jgi:hypothetical protein
LCRCKDFMIERTLGDTNFCALGYSLFLIYSLSKVQIYLNMASIYYK